MPWPRAAPPANKALRRKPDYVPIIASKMGAGMRLRLLAAALAAALLGGCSGRIDQTVERSVDEVETSLEAAAKDNLYLAAQLPGAAHSVESSAGRIVWHFTLNDQDYARMVLTMAAA